MTFEVNIEFLDNVDITYKDILIALENEITKHKTLASFIEGNSLSKYEYALTLQVFCIVYDCINVYVNGSKYITFFRDSYKVLFDNIADLVFG